MDEPKAAVAGGPSSRLRDLIATAAEDALDESLRARTVYPVHSWADIEAVADAVVAVLRGSFSEILQCSESESVDLLEAWAAIKAERTVLMSQAEMFIALTQSGLALLEKKS